MELPYQLCSKCGHRMDEHVLKYEQWEFLWPVCIRGSKEFIESGGKIDNRCRCVLSGITNPDVKEEKKST